MKKADKWVVILAIVLFIAIILALCVLIIITPHLSEYPPSIFMGLSVWETDTDWVIWVSYVLTDFGPGYHKYICVEIINADNITIFHRSLKDFTPGEAIEGVTFYEISHNNIVDAGEYFLLDKSIYGPGNRFVLRTTDGELIGSVVLE